VLRDQRRTKIICTLGPASDGDILPRLLEAGMNVARLNFSHGTQAEHGARIKRLRELAGAAGLPLAILQDLAGPKVRIGDVPGGEVTLREGEVIVDIPQVFTETPLGAPILLADGSIELRVETRTDTVLNCRVVVGGVLRSHVGINFPMHSLKVPSFTEKDREDLRFGIAQGVDFIALSSVRSRQDILEAKEFMRHLGADIPVIAKIEKNEALSRLEEILDEADGLMVARGDLGVEIPLEEVPVVQKRIIAAANRAGKPVITATQMLLSMVSHSRPSRAEATDVANAIFDGTDAVMLSEETAAGQFPVEAVKFLDRVSRVTEADFPHAAWLRNRAPSGRQEIPAAVSYSACEMAQDLEARAILTNTEGGGTARLISRFRPSWG
jgi:pyruvate kinase